VTLEGPLEVTGNLLQWHSGSRCQFREMDRAFLERPLSQAKPTRKYCQQAIPIPCQHRTPGTFAHQNFQPQLPWSRS